MKIRLSMVVTEHTPDPGTLARKAESLGFDAMLVGDHPAFPARMKPRALSPRELEVQKRANIIDAVFPEYYAQFPDPFVTLAMAAAVTSRLKIGTAVCLVSEREPIALAKSVATLDRYSNGRLVFTVGTGGIPEESEAFGVNYRRRWVVARERIRAMKELWTKPEASFEGEFVRFPLIKSNPKPMQKPHPPLIIGAGGAGRSCMRAMRDVVALGDGWTCTGLTPEELAQELVTLQRLCKEAGRDFSKLQISISNPRELSDPSTTLQKYSDAGAHALNFILWPELLRGTGLEDTARKYLN